MKRKPYPTDVTDYPELERGGPAEPRPTVFGRVIDRIRLGRGIKIQGVDGLMVRYAQCCQPVPGDPVIGYVTQGRGISIHRSDCPNLLTLSADERRVEIDWQETQGESFAVRLAVTGEDRRGLYADIMEAISQTGTNIRAADILPATGPCSAPSSSRWTTCRTSEGDQGRTQGEGRQRDRASGGSHHLICRVTSVTAVPCLPPHTPPLLILQTQPRPDP